MALSDLAVFSEYAYESMIEGLDYQFNLFNGASNGTIVLRSGANQGDYNESAMFQLVSGVIRTRDPNGTGDLSAKALTHILDRSVKVAKGTYPLDVSPSMFLWIQQNPQEAGAAFGMQVAQQTLADYLAQGVGAARATIAANASLTNDVSAATDKTMQLSVLNGARAKFGDRGMDIAAWVMHSDAMYQLWGNALTNAERLFVYNNVAVVRDTFGTVFVVADIPGLKIAGTPTKIYTLGLTQGAIVVEQNNDLVSNIDTRNGKDNIVRTLQSEWSFNLGLKGYAWDKVNGGAAPTDGELTTATNWDKFVTSLKDTAGVCTVTV